MASNPEDLLKLLRFAVENQGFRELMQEGDYGAAFRLVGLEGPTSEQTQALEELAGNWRPLQDLATSFGLPGSIFN